MRATFLIIIVSLICGNCRNGAIPSGDPPVDFLALRGTACIGHTSRKAHHINIDLLKSKAKKLIIFSVKMFG